MKRIILTLTLLMTCLISNSLDYKIIKAKTGVEVTFAQLIQELKVRDVVFFGELHDDPLLHSIKTDIFKELTKADNHFILGLESLGKNDQQAVNHYLKGQYSYQQLEANADLWSNHKESYNGLIDYAKANKIAVLATNTPIYISGLVAREGYSALEKLAEKERSNYARVFKPLANDYKKMFIQEMSDITDGESAQVNSLILERLYEAQALKDDTMAESIFDYLENNRQGKVFHINGDFHSKNHFGVYQKLELLNSKLNIASISPVYFPSKEPLKWDYQMFGLSEYIIMYHRDEKSSPLNNKADTSEFLAVDKHNISFIFEPGERVLTVNDQITLNQNFAKNKLLISKDIKELKVFSGKKQVDYTLKEYNKKFDQIEVNHAGKLLNFVYIYDYPKNKERPYHFNLQEYMWHPIVAIGEKSTFEVNALGPKRMKFIAPGEVTISPQSKDAIYYVWKSFDKENGFAVIGDLYFTKSIELDGIRITLYSFEENYPLLEDYAFFVEQYFNTYKQYFGAFGYDSFSIIQSADNSYKTFDNMLLVSKDVFSAKDIFISPSVLGHDLSKVWIDSQCQWNQAGANWQEMLSNFISNYLWLEKKQPAEAYLWRKVALEDISSIPRAEIKSLQDFSFPDNQFSAVNGYKIGGMVFYYLYNKVGEKAFFTALRDIFKSNKTLSGAAFFTALEKKTGVTELTEFIQDVYPVRVYIDKAEVKAGRTKIKIISTKGKKSNFDLEIKISDKDNFVITNYHIDKQETVLEFGMEAVEITLDPDYKLYRYLDNEENIFNLKRTFLEKPLLLVPQDSEQFSEIYNIGNTLRSNGVAIDMMPLSSLNEFEWKEKSLIYIGKFYKNPIFEALQPYLPPSFTFGKNKFTYEGKAYDKKKYSLIINTKNPFVMNKSISMWLWNSDKEINNIQAIFNYTTPSWVILEYNGVGFTEVAKGNLIDENLFPTKLNLQRGK